MNFQPLLATMITIYFFWMKPFFSFFGIALYVLLVLYATFALSWTWPLNSYSMFAYARRPESLKVYTLEVKAPWGKVTTTSHWITGFVFHREISRILPLEQREFQVEALKLARTLFYRAETYFKNLRVEIYSTGVEEQTDGSFRRYKHLLKIVPIKEDIK